MAIMVAVSVGEAIDKLTILEIKTAKIKEDWKLEYLGREMAALRQALGDALGGWLTFEDLQLLFDNLKSVNENLWATEDAIRIAMRKHQDSEILLLAQLVPRLNDKRARIKDQINEKYDAVFREIKQLPKYPGSV